MKGKKAKILRIVLITIPVILFLLYVVLPAGFGLFVSIRMPGEAGEPPFGFLELTLKTDDGVDIAAWYKEPENGAAVLVIHGSNCSRESVRPYVDMLAKHGYGVMAIDLRGHGESTGAANALGWQRDMDIAAALKFLHGEGIEAIGALGTSLGGESLLGVCSKFPEIKAIVSDGATHSTLADYLVLPSRENLWRSWTTRVMYTCAQLFTGQTPPDITMLDSIKCSLPRKTRKIVMQNTKKRAQLPFISVIGALLSIYFYYVFL